MLDCSLNMRTLQHFLPQMLVPNQRFDAMPFYRSPQTGQQFDNLKEFNQRVYLNTTLEFSIPEFGLINVEDLDAVLISSYNSMLALPYLTKMKGFRATVYCTEPIMQFGKMLMDELTFLIKSNQMVMINNEKSATSSNTSQSSIKTSAKTVSNTDKYPLFRTLSNLAINFNKREKSTHRENEQKPFSEEWDECGEAMLTSETVPSKKARLDDEKTCKSKTDQNSETFTAGIDEKKLETLKQTYMQLAQVLNITETHMKPVNWKHLYSKEDVEACMGKIKLIDFNERIDVFGALTVHAKSSGHSIGSCNWSIESDCDTLAYLGKSSLLNTHSKAFNTSFLKHQHVDCLIANGLSQCPNNDPEQMITEFCKACVATVKQQGSVLVPTLPTGKIYDIIECLWRYLQEAQLANTPVYFVSHVAPQSLAYSNIFAEWLCDSKQQFVYAAESPFQHAELVKSNLIKVYPSITSKFNEDFHQPCILFASHPSLRFGDACHFVEYWKNSPNNSFIFIEPDFNYLDALSPYQPIYANYFYFPIETSLTSHQFHKLCKETKQLNSLLVSNAYNHSDNLIKLDKLPLSTKLTFLAQNDIIKLDSFKRKYENCDIEADLALMIMPSKKNFLISKDINDLNANNIAFATFNAQLCTKNNHHVLKAAPRTIPLTRRDRLNESNLRKYCYGKLNVEKFLNTLRHYGLNTFKLTEKEPVSATSYNNKNGDKSSTNGIGNLSVSSIDNETLLVNEKPSLSSSRHPFLATAQDPIYLIEFDPLNRIQIDLNTNQVNVFCDNEDLRVKVKDSLLKCIKTL